MANITERKYRNSYSHVQIRLKTSERNKLRVLCAELGMTVQEFIKRLLMNKFPGVIIEAKKPRKFSQLVSNQELITPDTPPEDNETLA